MPVTMAVTESSCRGVAFSVVHLPSVTSTNDYVLAHLHALPHGAAVVADCQRAGRGRRGHTWHSPSGNLYLTVLLKELPETLQGTGAGGLTLLAALSVCDVIEARRLSPSIKWPNDVLLDDRKVAGILAEGAWQDGRLAWVAIGIGVNLNMSREEAEQVDRPIAVLGHELGVPVDRDAFVRDLLNAIGRLLERTHRGGMTAILPEIRQRLTALGSSVSVEMPCGLCRGTLAGLDEDGGLLLRDEHGKTKRIVSGVMKC